MSASDAPEPGQTLIDHLTELRTRIVYSGYAVLVTTVICWLLADKILLEIVEPVRRFVPDGKLIFLHPVDMFMAHLKVAVVCGIIVACPFWLYQAWKFVAPGLHMHERKYAIGFIAAGTGLFLVGVSFAYFLVIPGALEFLLTFGSSIGRALITLSDYLSFFTLMILVFGASFELPLVIVILGLMGIVDQKFLREKRRYAIVILAAIAAFITPPDALSMLMLLVPLWVLYEISILIVGFLVERRSSPGN